MITAQFLPLADRFLGRMLNLWSDLPVSPFKVTLGPALHRRHSLGMSLMLVHSVAHHRVTDLLDVRRQLHRRMLAMPHTLMADRRMVSGKVSRFRRLTLSLPDRNESPVQSPLSESTYPTYASTGLPSLRDARVR